MRTSRFRSRAFRRRLLEIGRYSSVRLLWFPVVLLAIVAFTFLALRLLPGDPAYLVAGPAATEENLALVRSRLGLDQPLPAQFVTYLANAARGDLGTSFFTGRPVLTDLLRRVPATLELLLYAMSLAFAFSFGLALWAVRGGVRARRAVRGITTLGMATPEFWLGLLLVYVFFYLLGVAPPPIGRLGELTSAPPVVTGLVTLDALLAGDLALWREAVHHLALPVVTLAFVASGPIAKIAWAAMSDVAESPYLYFARANNLPTTRQVRYAVRSALPPVLTIAGQQTAYLVSGAVLIEVVFGWGGIGQYAVDAILANDFNAVQAVVSLTAAFTVVVYLAVDVAHAWLDPQTIER